MAQPCRALKSQKIKLEMFILSFIVFETLSFGFRVRISNCAYEVSFWLLNCYSKSFWIENDLITSCTGTNCGTYQHTPTRAQRMAKLFFFHRESTKFYVDSLVVDGRGGEGIAIEGKFTKRWEADWKKVIYIQFLVALRSGIWKLSTRKFSFHQRPSHSILMYAWIADSF